MKLMEIINRKNQHLSGVEDEDLKVIKIKKAHKSKYNKKHVILKCSPETRKKSIIMVSIFIWNQLGKWHTTHTMYLDVITARVTTIWRKIARKKNQTMEKYVQSVQENIVHLHVKRMKNNV